MTRDRERADGKHTRSASGLMLLGGTLVLALASAATLVLTDDLRWLRLGAVGALWAALFGAFVAARSRGQAPDPDRHTADLQKVYELELEREVAARREYELQVESEIRSKVESEARDDLAALREELRSLRTTLEGLLGGQVLVERYALHAESTRMRSLPDGSHQLPGPPTPVKRLGAGISPQAAFPEPVTQRIERIVEVRGHQVPYPEPAPRSVETSGPGRVARTQHPAEVSDRWFVADAFSPGPEGQAPSTAGDQPGQAALPNDRRPYVEGPKPTATPQANATQAARNGRPHRATEHPAPPSSGSHSQGQSVADLLAAHGATPPRRRRRAQ
jgi:hypothetical protein